MQQIERYGVIALLLLLVTVLAVSMWGGDETANAALDTPTLASAPATRRAANNSREQALRTPRTANQPRQNSRLNNRLALTPSQANRAKVQRPRAKSGNVSQLQLPDQTRRSGTAPAATPIANRDFAMQDSQRRSANKQPRFKPVINQQQNQASRNLVVSKEPTPAAKPVKEPAYSTRPAAKPTTTTRPTTWTVKSGETLSGIASKALGSAKLWPQIAAANPKVDPNRLRVGTKLVLPVEGAESNSTAVATRPAKPVATPKAAGTYTVRSGDVLSIVAQRELGSAKRWREIVALNPGCDPNRLRVGEKLKMPAGAAKKVNTPRSTPRVAVATPSKSRRVR